MLLVRGNPIPKPSLTLIASSLLLYVAHCSSYASRISTCGLCRSYRSQILLLSVSNGPGVRCHPRFPLRSSFDSRPMSVAMFLVCMTTILIYSSRTMYATCASRYVKSCTVNPRVVLIVLQTSLGASSVSRILSSRLDVICIYGRDSVA